MPGAETLRPCLQAESGEALGDLSQSRFGETSPDGGFNTQWRERVISSRLT